MRPSRVGLTGCLFLAFGVVAALAAEPLKCPLLLEVSEVHFDARAIADAVTAATDRPLFLVRRKPPIEVEQVIDETDDPACTVHWANPSEIKVLARIGVSPYVNAAWRMVANPGSDCIPPGRYRIRMQVTDVDPRSAKDAIRIWTLYSRVVMLEHSFDLARGEECPRVGSHDQGTPAERISHEHSPLK